MLDVGLGHGVVLYLERRPVFYRDGTAHALATALVHRTLTVRFTLPDGSRVCRSVGRLLRGVAVVDVPEMTLVSRDNTWALNSLVWMSAGDARRVSRWNKRVDDLPHRPVELTPAAALEVMR